MFSFLYKHRFEKIINSFSLDSSSRLRLLFAFINSPPLCVLLVHLLVAVVDVEEGQEAVDLPLLHGHTEVLLLPFERPAARVKVVLQQHHDSLSTFNSVRFSSGQLQHGQLGLFYLLTLWKRPFFPCLIGWIWLWVEYFNMPGPIKKKMKLIFEVKRPGSNFNYTTKPQSRNAQLWLVISCHWKQYKCLLFLSHNFFLAWETTLWLARRVSFLCI